MTPPLDWFYFTQYRIDPTVYKNENYVLDPVNDQHASKYDYTSQSYAGAKSSNLETYMHIPQHHYTAVPQLHSRDQNCVFGLRLTENIMGSKGSVTYANKVQVAYGFSTEFTMQILHSSQECVSTICRENFGEGFAFIIQNQNQDIDSLGLTYGSGLGYQGINQAIVVEFDFTTNAIDDPSYPHVSVQYTDGMAQSSHDYSLGFAYLPSEITDSKIHNFKITYERQINKVDFRQQNFVTTEHSTYYMNQIDYAGDWFLNYTVGLLSVYVDDMEFPILSTPVNMAYCTDPDNHLDVNEFGIVDPLMAGKAYVSISATTSDIELRYGNIQLLRWIYDEVPQCPITQAICSNTKELFTSTYLKLTMRNIGPEKLYFKFKHHNPQLYSLNPWFDCRVPPSQIGFYEDQEIKIEASIFDPINYGCLMDIYYDTTVNDIIIHDFANSTWTSIANVYGTFDNSFLLVNEVICAEKQSNEIILTTCT